MTRRVRNLVLLLSLWIVVSSLTLAEPGRKLTTHIPMRDGKFLAADILLPPGDGPFPTIYVHTPYMREHVASPTPDAPFRRELMDRENYAYVVTDWRGFHDSKAAKWPLRKPDHGLDGYDAVEWIAKQSWSNQKIGMWGSSAPGGACHWTAAQKPPHLTAIVASSALPTVRYAQFYTNGVEAYQHLATVDAVGHGGKQWVEKHPRYDRFWRLIESKVKVKDIDLPVLLITGWYDTNPDQKLGLLDELRTGKQFENDMRLLVGPWHHTAIGKAKQGELFFQNAAGVSGTATLEFFDRYLRDLDNDWDNLPSIRYYEMPDRWRSADSWPPKTEAYVLNLQVDGTLTAQELETVRTLTFHSNPSNPIATPGGASIIEMKGGKTKAGPYQLKALDNRSDTLEFHSDILKEDLVVVGEVTLELSVSTTAKDADFMVWLAEQTQDGRTMLVTDGTQKLSCRESDTKKSPVESGVVYPLRFGLSPICKRFSAGSRIKLILAGSNYPKFKVNRPGGGQSVHFGENRQARLSIPISNFRASEVP
jgi:predicted acyl esterase